MIVTVEKKVITKTVKEIDVEFPFYGWSDWKKEHLIKIQPIYHEYQSDIVDYFKVIHI
jgi:hypothetical protein